MHVVCLSFLGLSFGAVLRARDARISESLEMPLDRLLTIDIASLIACTLFLQRAPSRFAIFTATDSFHRKRLLCRDRQRHYRPHQDMGLHHIRLKHGL